MLVGAVLGHIVVNNSLNYRLDLFRRDELVATFDNHCEDLSNLVLLMGGKISEYIGVELEDHQFVAPDKSRHHPQHVELHLVPVVALLQLGEQSLGHGLRIIKHVDGEEIGLHVSFILALLLSLLMLDRSVQLLALGLREFGPLVVLEDLAGIFFVGGLFI